MKGTIFSVLLIALALVMVSSATAALNIDYVRINGEIVDDNDNLRIDLGEDLDIRVRLSADNDNSSDYDDVEVMARIVGHEYRDREGNLIDIEGPFQMDAGDTENADLELTFPLTAEKDEYELRIEVSDRRNDLDSHMVTLRVRDPRTALNIRDVIMSPSSYVEAGRALLVQARVENLGNRDLDDVLVRAEIPELNIEGSTFLNEEIEGSEQGDPEVETSEEILLRIPPCAEPGVYDVIVTAEYDRYEETSVTETIRVVASDSCGVQNPGTQQPSEDRTVVVQPQPQNIQVGTAGASYPVVISNMGTSARTYTVTVSGLADWGVAEVSQPAVTIQAGESKVVYVFVSANADATAGQKVFSISVNDKSFQVVANVLSGESQDSWGGLRKALEIGLIVLVVLLIILGLIVGFSKLRKDDESEEGKTYY